MSDWVNQVDWNSAALLAENTLAVLRPFAEPTLKKIGESALGELVKNLFDVLKKGTGEPKAKIWLNNPDEHFTAVLNDLAEAIESDAEFKQELRETLKTTFESLAQAGATFTVSQEGLININAENITNTGNLAIGPGAQAGANKASTGNIDQVENSMVVVAGRDIKIGNVTIATGRSDPEEDKRHLDAYLRWVEDRCATLSLRHIMGGQARPDRQPPGLTQIYVDLDTTITLPKKTSYVNWRQLADEEREKRIRRATGEELDVLSEIGALASIIAGKELDQEKVRRLPVLEAMATHRLVALKGKPGSGKSTLARYIALTLARAALYDSGELARLGEWWTHGLLWPVTVTLRQFADSRALPSDCLEGRAGHLWDFIREELHNAGHSNETVALLEQITRKHGALFLLDGLDEVPDSERRKRVLESAADFVKTMGNHSRVLMTSRPYAWDDIGVYFEGETTQPKRPAGFWARMVDWLQRDASTFFEGLDLQVFDLADFNNYQIDTFIERWYATIMTSGWVTADEATTKEDELKTGVRRVDLRPLAVNPLLLTLMASLHTSQTRLPDDRADLYDQMVELMLQRWNEATGQDKSLLLQLGVEQLKLKDLRDVFQEVAFKVHLGHVGQTGTADIAQGVLQNAFRGLFGGDFNKAQIVVDYIERRAGLLIGLGERDGQTWYTFPHRTFQEYLAACFLAEQPDYVDEVERLARSDAGHWREVLPLAARVTGAARAIPAIDTLVKGQTIEEYQTDGGFVTAEDAQVVAVAARQINELGLAVLQSRPQYTRVGRRVASWLEVLVMGTELPATERAEAGRVLAQLGDNRPGVGVDPATGLPDIRWCFVPGGPFVMGANDISDDEKPQHPNEILKDGYWLAQYPVTQAQFGAFVQAGGYAEQRYWVEAEEAEVWVDGRVRVFSFSYKEKGIALEPTDRYRSSPESYGGAFDLPNHPVVGVSWYEALAFARWLNEQYQTRLPAGYHITLPSEAEWEKAARGGLKLPSTSIEPITGQDLRNGPPSVTEWQDNPLSTRRYPWGDQITPEHANYNDTRLGSTSAVGAFAGRGISPYGCLDLSGNVWEWTRSLYQPYDEKDGYDKLAERENLKDSGRRVLRGASFDDNGSSVRCAYRNGNFPFFRDDFSGFRVAVALNA